MMMGHRGTKSLFSSGSLRMAAGISVVVATCAFIQTITTLVAVIVVGVITGLAGVFHAAWVPPSATARFDLAGNWRLAEPDREVFLFIGPDGTIVLDGWPRDIACIWERTDSLTTKADLDWQNPTRVVGKISSASESTTLFTSFDETKNVCASQQTFFIEVNTRDGSQRLLRFINGVTDEDEGIEPLVFYRNQE